MHIKKSLAVELPICCNSVSSDWLNGTLRFKQFGHEFMARMLLFWLFSVSLFSSVFRSRP